MDFFGILMVFKTFMVGAVLSAPISGTARNVKSDLVLINKLHSGPQSNEINNFNDDVPIGESLDLFYRYGFFSLSVRVVPRDDPGSWIVREPTITIFESNSVSKTTQNELNMFEPNFQMYFCDDESELFEAYFKDFSAEEIEQPHKLYSGSWHTSTKAKYFGLTKEAFDGESSFVLVKLPKKRFTQQVSGGSLKSRAASEMQNVQPGHPDTVIKFIRDFGSHYIQSITVGDLIYQVYALDSDQYAAAKSAMLSQNNINHESFKAFHANHLAPWAVRETGKVLLASGDRQALQFAEQELVDQGRFGSYPNLLKLQEDPRLMFELEQLTVDTTAVIGMRFASLTPWVPDIQAREFYKGVVATQSSLWDSNL